jgi:hypothetical protein
MSPTITSMIRLDHMHVLAAFHRYHADSPWWRKRAIVNSTCASLEIHAQLEEEIFYPALATVLTDDPTLSKSRPEHNEMRATIGRLRPMVSETMYSMRLPTIGGFAFVARLGICGLTACATTAC